MSSVYERKDRDYLYATVRDPVTLKWRSIRTPFKKDSPAARRNALIWADSKDRLGAETRKIAVSETWGRWVDPWLEQAYGYNPKTLKRYQNAWAPLNEFLVEHEISLPRELVYRHASEYLDWRTKQKRHRGTTINHNTAIVEMKVMSRIMREAQRRGYCDSNPWYQLGFRRQNVKHAPAMTLDEIEQHRAALREREGKLTIDKRWMTVSFEIALHHGVRLSETSIPMAWVHLDPRTTDTANYDRITVQGKGRNGVPKTRAIPLNPALRTMMLELKRRGARMTCELPRMAAKEWWKFRRDHKLSHLRFHSTRSTVATELARNNVPIQKAKEILGHASEAVHLAYLHLNAADVADEIRGISFPSTQDTRGTAGVRPPRR